jgi:hypothetical protein
MAEPEQEDVWVEADIPARRWQVRIPRGVGSCHGRGCPRGSGLSGVADLMQGELGISHVYLQDGMEYKVVPPNP